MFTAEVGLPEGFPLKIGIKKRSTMRTGRKITKILIANRSEIAIRILRAANELEIPTVSIWSEEDRHALHRFKADEAYQIGRGPHLERPLGAIESYLSIGEVIRVARQSGADAIHPGYGLLSESPELAEACAHEGLLFIGPRPATLRILGNKVTARELAKTIGVPTVPATPPLPHTVQGILEAADALGFPLMLKASWGGGGRGMRAIRHREELIQRVSEGRREASAAFGKDEVYLERLVERARHVEVQILGDAHGNVVHLFERDCSIQRRNQKVVERAPAPYLNDRQREELCDYALRIGRTTEYVGAGTVEFLMDVDTGNFFFIEVNPRIQVEHTVTEQVTGIDIVQAQIRIAEGAEIGASDCPVPPQEHIRLNGHALQCRITTEDPERDFAPDHGRIVVYRGATGFGIRLDGGTAYAGAMIGRSYDPLLEKVTAWAPTPEGAIARMKRALREFRIRGIATNLTFLEAVVNHAQFRENDYTTRFIDTTPDLVAQVKRRDRATKLLNYVAEVTVNGHPETRERTKPKSLSLPIAPAGEDVILPGLRQRLVDLGARGLAAWMRDSPQLLVTDTSMRDAHQSLLATRVRTYDIAKIAGVYARNLPELFSLECWGGATFDVAMRYLTEDPWERLSAVREQAPNLLLQMLLRGANAVGYANYPDNVIRHFVERSAASGIDVFRVFDCLNWVPNMRVAIDAVCRAGALCEGTICYTGDVLDPRRDKYDLKYYVDLAKQLDDAGVHVLALKDMAGVMKPAAARALIAAIRQAVDLPIHFHTHDTSGAAAATIMAAIDEGVDAVDAAMDSMSGGTSQPCLGSILAALKDGDRDPGLDPGWVRRISSYWEAVRSQYAAFESEFRAPASEVYLHEMPGGQFTNLKEQVRAMGLEDRWSSVAETYRDVNMMFGDIVKVTPSSKVVGDMALMMVSQGHTRADVEDPAIDVAFPDSVVAMFRGDLGQPPGGWPPALQSKVLKGATPITRRPGALLAHADLAAERAKLELEVGRTVSENEFCSWLMYPKVFKAFLAAQGTYGPVSKLPTPVYFYGMVPGQEIEAEIETGKSLLLKFVSIGEMSDDGTVTVFFEVNGQPRQVTVADRSRPATEEVHRKAELGNGLHLAAPIAGLVSMIAVSEGQAVAAGDLILSIEAMKMETSVRAEKDCAIGRILVARGEQIEANDLLLEFAELGAATSVG